MNPGYRIKRNDLCHKKDWRYPPTCHPEICIWEHCHCVKEYEKRKAKMNRRNFLKRIAAVAVSTVAVPTVAKKLFFKLNPVQRNVLYTWEISCIGGKYDGYCPPSEPSKFPDYKLGTLYRAPDWTLYRYVKLTKCIKGGYHVNCRRCKRTDLHDHTRCTA